MLNGFEDQNPKAHVYWLGFDQRNYAPRRVLFLFAMYAMYAGIRWTVRFKMSPPSTSYKDSVFF